jgi:Flp pilus assembly protein CpaB
MTEAEYNTRVQSARLRVNGGDLLVGNQPVGRTTVRPVRAEEPIFENQLEPLSYPEPVSNRLRPGKRAVILEVPSTEAMVQVGDVVDVLCTMSSTSFGTGADATRTAAVVKNARVIARFNTTQTAARPAPGSTTRTYTLEVNPYRYGLIELARSNGARFALSVTERPVDDGAILPASAVELNDPETDLVTREDLDRLFGVEKPEPEKRWTIERISGTENRPPLIYQYNTPAVVPLKPAGSSRLPAPDVQIRPAVNMPANTESRRLPPTPRTITFARPESAYPHSATNWRLVSDDAVASAAPTPPRPASPANRTEGYRAPPSPTATPCVGPGCGKKR